MDEKLMVACPRCTLENSPSRQFCEVCGGRLRERRPSTAAAASSPIKQGGSSKKRSHDGRRQPSIVEAFSSSPLGKKGQASKEESGMDASRVKRAREEPAQEVDALESSAFDPSRGVSSLLSSSRVLYEAVARVLDAVSATRSRLAKDRILTNAFRWLRAASSTVDEVEAACYLIAPVRDTQAGGHRLQPDWEHRPLGLSWRVVEAALVDSLALSSSAWKAARAKHGGDRGEAAAALCRRGGNNNKQQSFFHVQSSRLTIVGAHSELLSLADLSGTGSDDAKRRKLTALFAKAARGHPTEIKWLARTAWAHTAGCGISLEASVLPAAAQGVLGFADKEMCRRAYARRPSVRTVLESIISVSSSSSSSSGLPELPPIAAGVPPSPMLAEPCSSFAEAWKKLAQYATRQEQVVWAERKYDGQRVGAHSLGRVMRLFSRKLDDMSDKYRSVGAAIAEAYRKTGDFVVDGEIVAAGGEDDHAAAPFQVLMQRTKGSPTHVYLFDVLVVDGSDVTGEPFVERRRILEEAFAETGVVRLAVGTRVERGDDEALKAALTEAVQAGCEGLVLKHPGAPYEIAPTRSAAWLKLKKDYLDADLAPGGLGDSFDLVAVGGWRGSGRKSRWISPILVAALEPDTGRLEGLCRVMSGFTDAFYKDLTTRVLGAELPDAATGEQTALPDDDDRDDPERETKLLIHDGNTKHPSVETDEQCSFWFQPTLVFEIRAADITLSPTHSCARGLVHPQRGLSLRFPRFIRLRPDKLVAQATTSHRIAQVYTSQTQGQRSAS